MGKRTTAHRRADRLTALGDAIRVARGTRSQTEIARRLDRPQSSISAWESGSVDLSAERLHELESALEVAPGTLLRAAGYLPDRDRPWWVGCGTPHEEERNFGNGLLDWLQDHGHLLAAAADLRSSGEEDALQELLKTQVIYTVRSCWEFWRSISGDEADVGLARVLTADALEKSRFALWGDGQAPAAPSRVGSPGRGVHVVER